VSTERNEAVAPRCREELWNGRMEVADEIFDPESAFENLDPDTPDRVGARWRRAVRLLAPRADVVAVARSWRRWKGGARIRRTCLDVPGHAKFCLMPL
jgi:hypothetical protein